MGYGAVWPQGLHDLSAGRHSRLIGIRISATYLSEYTNRPNSLCPRINSRILSFIAFLDAKGHVWDYKTNFF